MKAVLVDTNIYSYAMAGEAEAVEIFQTHDQILFSPVTVGELLAGFRQGSRAKQNASQLRRFLAGPRVQVVPVTEETAQFYALILTQLRRQGTPIPTNDIWIAASALEHGAALATRDAHFGKIDGLLLLS